MKKAEKMLALYDLPATDIMRYWCWYLLERIAFWRRGNEEEFAGKFVELFRITLDKMKKDR